MLGTLAKVRVVHPIGSEGDNGFIYPMNYGLIYGKRHQMAYVIGINHPVKNFDGRVVALLTKGRSAIWIVAPKSSHFIIHDIKRYIDTDKYYPSYTLECLYESSCGAVVFKKDENNKVKYLLIKNLRSRNWGFPKGHIEKGETKEMTAIREVLEETGLHINLLEGFSWVSKYKIKHNDVKKDVTIFVATTDDDKTIIQEEEISDYVWLSYDEAKKNLNFPNDKIVLTEAHRFLLKNNYI